MTPPPPPPVHGAFGELEPILSNHCLNAQKFGISPTAKPYIHCNIRSHSVKYKPLCNPKQRLNQQW